MFFMLSVSVILMCPSRVSIQSACVYMRLCGVMLTASSRGETEAGVPVQEGARGQTPNN